MEKRKRKTGARGKAKASAPAVEAAVRANKVDVPPREELIPGLIEPQTSVARGPHKKGLEGAPPPRLEYHKKRSKWFQARAAWPYREAPTRTMVRERGLSKKALAPAPGPAQWELVGPTNIGGRMTSIVCH